VSRAQEVGGLTADIPGQPLPEALAAYARQTGLQLVYVSKIAQGKSSAGAEAGLPPREALSRLLEGTGLQFQFLNERSVRIFAQRQGSSKPAPPHGSPAPPQSAATEEVIVTGFAQEQSVDRAPLTVSVWTAAEMEAAGITRLDSLAGQTAGAYFMQSSRNGPGIDTALFLRGLNGTPGNSNVGVYIDDVPVYGHSTFESWGDFAPLTFDLDRVEVLYGSQGTLGGDAAEAGAVRYITRQPSLTNWSGFATSSAATTEHGAPSYEIGAAAGGPIVTDVAGFRASLWWRSDGGYVDRVDPFNGVVLDANANHISSSSGRVAFTLAPTDAVRITPSFMRQAIDLHDAPAFYDYLSSPGAGIILNGKLLRQPSDDTFYLGSVTVTMDLPTVQLTSVTAYTNRTMFTIDDVTNAYGLFFFGGWGNPLGVSYPSSYLDAVPSTLNDKQTQLSQEFRLASSDPGAPLTWLLGTWLSHAITGESDLIAAVDPTVGAALDGYSWTSVSTIETDVFGQVNARIADRLRATAGLRISHDQFQTTGIQSGPLNSGAPPSFSMSGSATPVAPHFGLTYTPEDYGVLYLSAAKGYRLGGVNPPPYSACNQPYFPTYGTDHMWNYEAGAKARSAGGSLQVDVALFHLVYGNIQQIVYVNCGQSYLTNAGTAASDGFDASLRFDALARLQLGAAVEYADARYTESVHLPAGYSITEGDALGIAPHVAPPWSGTAWINAIVWPAQRPQASVRVSGVFRSHNPGPFNTDNPADGMYAPGWRSDPATMLVNLRTQLSWPSVELSAFMYNVFNSQPLLSHMTDSTRADLYYDETFRPRTYGVALSLRF
jgi:outer membrane receptor protein involved in Fe transport